MSAWLPLSRKYSPIVTPVYGARNCSGAGSDAVGGDDDRVLHRAGLAQLVDDRGHRRLLLADGDVDADDVLALLVDDRVDRDGGLAGLAVADDQLALAAADRDHRVDGLDAGLQRLVHRLAGDDAGRLDLDLAASPWWRSGPCRRSGWPSALTTRPRSSSPTGTSAILPVRLTCRPRGSSRTRRGARRRRCPLRG